MSTFESDPLNTGRVQLLAAENDLQLCSTQLYYLLHAQDSVASGQSIHV